jgi:hypothetical protein
MLGKRKPQRDLFDVGNVFALELDPHSFHGQLAAAAPRLFHDDDFARFYADRLGRPSVPPSQLALLTLLQHEAGCSDQEAVARSAFDLRWAAVLGRSAGTPLCAKSTFQLFRAHLVLHDGVRTIFERSLQQAKAAGLLARGPLKIAVDTKPILGRGAVEDTYNLLGQAIQQLIRVLAQQARLEPQAWAQAHSLSSYFAPSLKGSADLDWSDATARGAFLAQIVEDARRLLHLADVATTDEDAPTIGEAAQLLRQLLLQDVIEAPPSPSGGAGAAVLRQGTVAGRVPSATDPEQRHGRKSESHRFTGYKGAIATDRDSQIILDAQVLEGSAPDAFGLLEQVARIERSTGERVGEVLGDCAYGSGETRQAFVDAGRELVAKLPQERVIGGRFPKSAFVLDLLQHTVTCPAGHTLGKFQREKDGGKLFHFGVRCRSCLLREQCTTAGRGRSVSVHPQEGMLLAARSYQESAAGRAHLRERVVVEHRLARLGQLGMGQARYLGRAKTGCQLQLLATIVNLRRVWNWVQEQAPIAPVTGREAMGAVA